MTLSRWRRVATGVAAGVIVLCAALIGASFRSDNTGVSVASDIRPSTTVIPIAEDPLDENPLDEPDSTDAVDTTDDPADDPATDDTGDAATDDTATDASEPVTVIEPDDLPDPDTDTAPEGDNTEDAEDASSDGADTTGDASSDETATDDAGSDETASGDAGSDETASDDDDEGETASADDSTETTATETATGTTSEQPLTAADDALGTGGGVDDAECALDRLVIYAGARRGGVAGSIRNALAQAGFAAACPAPVTVLASNCPLQFAGVLGAGSGYDPMRSYVASSSSVDRETMTAVMGAVGYSGSEINILDFSFVNPDRPGEQWMAIFIPPSFTGWENLASRAGLGPTASSLCAPSGEFVG